MASGWRYRITAVLGVVLLVIGATAVANHPLVGTIYAEIPWVKRLSHDPATGMEFIFEAGVATAVVVGALVPLYKPRPQRILNIALLAAKRTLVALLALATIGYFDYTYRLPRSTLVVAGVILLVALPVWFVTIRSRPTNGNGGRTIIIGDDPREIDRILATIDFPVLGYVSPTPYVINGGEPDTRVQVTDGAGELAEGWADGSTIECLGGLSRLDDILVEHDVDTAIFAFNEADREEFFGVLATCHEHGVDAKIHRDQADTLLTDGDPVAELVDIDVEPWDWQDRAIKRAFDIAFAGTGLLIALPFMIVIAVAIKLDSAGPLFYSQERTAEFGETFRVYKFRSMVEDAEAQTGAKLSEEDKGGRDPRVTRVGRVLRKTHLDEMPQLWSILVGDMSTVGPRPERPELDHDIEVGVADWRRRWFVRPGLTGLAQINDVTGHEPEQKLRYDVEYIRKQSFWFDLKIVLRQIWLVLGDLVRTVAGREDETDPGE